MKLYLVQHGKSVDREVDPQRPLTDAGRREVQKVAWALNRNAIKPSLVCHSGKLRARQTAEIFAAELRVERVLRHSCMTPKADAAEFVASLADDGAMYVGHLPHLQRVASILLTGSPELEAVAFVNSAVLCLAAEDSRYRVAWYIPAEVC